MTAPTTSQSTAELRVKIAKIRQDLAAATQAYYSARSAGRGNDVISLLRKRSMLIKQLFQAQSELLLALRSRPQSELQTASEQGGAVGS